MVDNIYVHIIPYNRQDFKQYVQPLFVKFLYVVTDNNMEFKFDDLPWTGVNLLT